MPAFKIGQIIIDVRARRRWQLRFMIEGSLAQSLNKRLAKEAFNLPLAAIKSYEVPNLFINAQASAYLNGCKFKNLSLVWIKQLNRQPLLAPAMVNCTGGLGVHQSSL